MPLEQYKSEIIFIIAIVEAHFDSLPVSYFRDGIYKLEDNRNRRVDDQGEYIE